MPRHDEILTELGLAPTWRRRDHPGFGGVTPAPVATMPAPSAVPRTEASMDPEARVARIATLEWRDFAADVDACVACGLARTRKKSVPGVGDVRAEWLFVGEAPGAEEDAKGEPFVGQAGKLLDNMLAALGMKRGENVYIANALKCRPPDNRTPEPGEIDACRPYLDRQIALIQPKLIVALGKSAATTLLGDRRHDREHARARPPLWRASARRHVPSRLPAAQLAGQSEGVGGSPVCPAHAARCGARGARNVVDRCASIACVRTRPTPFLHRSSHSLRRRVRPEEP